MRKILGFLISILLFYQCGWIKEETTNIPEPVKVRVEKEKVIVFDTLFLEKCYTKGHYGSIYSQKVTVPGSQSLLVEQEFIVDSTMVLQFDTIIVNDDVITKRHLRTYNGYTELKIYSDNKELIFEKIFKPLERRIQNKEINKLYQDFFFANYYNLKYININENSLIFTSSFEYYVCDTLGRVKHFGILPYLSSYISDYINSHNIFITSSEIYDISNSKAFSFSSLSNKTLLRYYILGDNIYLIFDGNHWVKDKNDIYVLSKDLTVQNKSQIRIMNSRSEMIEGINGGKKVALLSHLTDSLLIIENKLPFNTEWFSIDSIKLFDNEFIYHEKVYLNCHSPLKNLILFVDTINSDFRKEFIEYMGD